MLKKNNLMKRLLCYEVLMPIFLMLFITSFIISVNDLPRIAKRMPNIVGFITLFFLVIELVKSIITVLKSDRTSSENSEPNKFLKSKVFLFVLIMIFYGLGIYLFGYFIPTCVMLFFTMRMIGEKSIVKIFLVSGGYLAIFYLTFVTIFGLYLPKGVVF